MQFNYSNISFPVPLLSRLVKIDTEEELKDELFQYAERNGYDKKEIVYFYVKIILKNSDFFKMKVEIAELLFFEAAYWASIKETKQKIRPKNFNDIKEKKVIKVFTKLQQFTIEALINEYYDTNDEIKKLKFNLELSKFLSLLFEVSCIKRDRLKDCPEK